MSSSVINAAISEKGNSLFAVTITVSGFTIDGDEPVAAGGGGTGPAPFDLLTAALGECTAMTVRWYANQQQWPLAKVEVEVSHQAINGIDHFAKKVVIHGDDLSETQRVKLIEVAAKCPIHRALERTPMITTVG